MSQSGEEDSSSSDDSSGWEEVTCDNSQYSTVPAEGLQITVPHDGLNHSGGRSKKKTDVHSLIRRELNRCTREYQEDLHKVNLLCLLSVGISYNKVLRSESILAAALSTLPSQQSYPPKNMDLVYVEKFIKWFCKKINLNDGGSAENDLMLPLTMEEQLISQINKAEALNNNYLVCIFILILRSLGVQARLIWSLSPVPLKPLSDDLLKDSSNKKAKTESSTNLTGSNATSKGNSSNNSSTNSSSTSTTNEMAKTKSRSQVGSQDKNTKKPQKSKKGKVDSDKTDRTPRKLYHTQEPEYLVSDDSDFEPPVRKKRKVPSSTNKVKSNKKPQKEVSTSMTKDTEHKVVGIRPEKKIKLRYDIWAEVYLEEEERWISVDLTTKQGSVFCDGTTFEAKATQPVNYVLSFGNEGNVKDVTRRYSSQWLTGTQKRRVDAGWWQQSMRPFRGRRTARDKAEDLFLDEVLLNQPIPKSIQELKGHPLYFLRRHLLKFEAIYPPEPMPLGYIKNEPIFSRDCVKTLHTKEVWLRQAKVVRIGEAPYKIVKSRPKYDKRLGQVIPDAPPAELFGEWQVENFMPAIAVDGKVPRNDYGNVELFQAKMLPKGTVHLQVPGLNRVAKKLDIDCARALVGFEYHSGKCHPTYDGFVVCEEFKDLLLDAWNQEQDEIEKKELEKKRKRVYSNWAKLVKGMLIRERLIRAGHTFSTPAKPKPNR